MAQPHAPPPPPNHKKRKEPPQTSNNTTKRPKTAHHRDARAIRTQTTSNALQNGVLDVDKFVQAREFEIRALEQSMQRSRKALNRRAFQQVPAELRRRTASHNVKRVPKRLRKRAAKEMAEDNTPTVTARRRTPTSKMRLRLETAKKLRGLGARKAQAATAAARNCGETVRVIDPTTTTSTNPTIPTSISTRTPKPKKSTPTSTTSAPILKRKYHKRQRNKSWLPTHLFHAKRAHLTPPSAPLWRFSIPLTPTQKSYRGTHRAATERGAVVWDRSYIATVCLEGREGGLVGLLKGIGVEGPKGVQGGKWLEGTRVLEAWAREREGGEVVAPITLIWCASPAPSEVDGETASHQSKRKRTLFLRTHPSAFPQLWTQLERLAKIAKPTIKLTDLRFEIGSISLVGPGSTEALLGALKPTNPEGTVEKRFSGLAGLTNTGSLPKGAVLGFSVLDPRLRHPPRTIASPTTQKGLEEQQMKLLRLLAAWPPDEADQSEAATLFDSKARQIGSKLPSQKSINRRKSLAPPGAYPATISTDPRIPILLHPNAGAGAGWMLLAPWKTIPALWYSLHYYPLSTGGQPRFGGLNETRQIAFEGGEAWFPGDFAGTRAGWEWEVGEREKRLKEWKARPKGKRVAWEKVELGGGVKGEIGCGWACDWGLLLVNEKKRDGEAGEDAGADSAVVDTTTAATAQEKPPDLTHLSSTQALALLRSPPSDSEVLNGQLFSIRLRVLARGVPEVCARLYRLPSSSCVREAWLAQLPSKGKVAKHKAKPLVGKEVYADQRLLAQSLLRGPAKEEEKRKGGKHPPCPGEEDLIGFVTMGGFNLREGVGTGVGCLSLGRLVRGKADGNGDVGEQGEARLCVVRNAGESVGWLARWEFV